MAKAGYSPIAKDKALESQKVGNAKPKISAHLTDTYINWVLRETINQNKSEKSSLSNTAVARQVVDYIKNEDSAISDKLKNKISASNGTIREGDKSFSIRYDRNSKTWYAVEAI